ncbi:MAG: hypothetical protein KGJ78_02415 [Alphaproteobacteria bacterium]|nr:hypothetical protein [Alphaproteobacteria bacterium]
MAASLACACVGAHAVDPSWYQDLHWRLVGPFRGGRVLAVTGVPGNDRRFYFGAVDGGVWATGDTGRTWNPIFDGEPEGSIGALAVAPSAPDTIYVGTGEADMRSDIAHGNGVYKSTDAGKTWRFVGLADSRQIGRILVDPANPDIVLVAALGHAYGPNAERGVFRSADGGTHWQKVLFKDDNTGAIDLAYKPDDANTVYAALWQTRRPPWSVYPPSNGPGSGLYVSHDGGENWSQVIGGGFPAHPGRMGIALTPAKPSRVYVLADGPPDEAGLYVSDDGGAHWTHASGDSRIWKRGWYFSGITADPKNADRVYVMNTIVLRSDDGGRHFIALKGDPTGDDFHQMWIDLANPDRMILGSDQGTQITLNGGKTWSSWYNQPTAQIYHVSTDNRFPYWIYGAQQDSGAVSLPSRTTTLDGVTMEQFRETTAGGESGMIAPDPDNPDIVYGNKVDKLDLRTGQTRSVDPTLAYPASEYRGAWTLPLVFSKRDTKTLYFANQRLFRTSDGGNHWAAISPDLTRTDTAIPANLDAPTAADDDHLTGRRGVIYAIAPSPLNSASLWVGTDDGLVWRTIDAGAHWINASPALTPWAKVAGIEPSHFAADTAYLAVDRHRLDDDKPYIYRTADGGRHWAAIVQGIPENGFVNVVREDPAHRGLLYAGTERGIFVSFDDGGHWQSLQQNLPMTSVRDIDVHGDDLVIATHGRGFWIMDDVTALRQTAVAQAGPFLFKPAQAIRLRPAGFTGTPMPKDEPTAANPANGAYIDYLLPVGTKGPVTLTIIDARNRKAGSFSSADKISAPDPATLGFAPEWAKKHAVLSTAPGMHRFVWNLHYPGPSDPANPLSVGGVWAMPGSYTVELGVDGRSMRQPLTVKPDPRVKLPPDAYKREFMLAMEVQDATAKCTQALAEASDLLGTLAKRRVQEVKSRPQIDKLVAAISRLTGLPAGPDVRIDPPFGTLPPGSLKGLEADLHKLGQAVDGADADPSADMRSGYAQLSRLLAAKLKMWHQLRRQELGTLHAGLQKAGDHPAGG